MNKKRIISFIMVLALCCSLFATAAYAEELNKLTGTITVKPGTNKGTVEVYRLFDNTEEEEVLAWRADESGKAFSKGFSPKETEKGAYYPFFCDGEENNGIVRAVGKDELGCAIKYLDKKLDVNAKKLGELLVKYVDKHEIKADLSEEAAETVVFEDLEYNYYLVVVRDASGKAVMAVVLSLNEDHPELIVDKNGNVTEGTEEKTEKKPDNGGNGYNGGNGGNNGNGNGNSNVNSSDTGDNKDDGSMGITSDGSSSDSSSDSSSGNYFVISVDKRIGKDKVDIGFGAGNDKIYTGSGSGFTISIPLPIG